MGQRWTFYRAFWKRRPVTVVFDQNTSELVLQCEVLYTEWTLVSSRIVRRKGVSADEGRSSQGYVPLCNQLHLIAYSEFTAALRIVPPQALLPQESAINSCFDLIQPEVLWRWPDFAP